MTAHYSTLRRCVWLSPPPLLRPQPIAEDAVVRGSRFALDIFQRLERGLFGFLGPDASLSFVSQVGSPFGLIHFRPRFLDPLFYPHRPSAFEKNRRKVRRGGSRPGGVHPGPELRDGPRGGAGERHRPRGCTPPSPPPLVAARGDGNAGGHRSCGVPVHLCIQRFTQHPNVGMGWARALSREEGILECPHRLCPSGSRLHADPLLSSSSRFPLQAVHLPIADRPNE